MTNSTEWDPNVVSARQTSDGPVAGGTTFEVKVRFAGRPVAFAYRVAEYERPKRVVLEAANLAVESRDTITLEALEGGGCTARYDAELVARPAFRLLSPLIDRSFRKIVDEASTGLRHRLAR